MHFLNSNSSQRQPESKKLRTLLTASFAASVVFHGVLLIFIPRWFSSEQSEKVEEPIELILVDKAKPIESVVPKPEPPKPEPTPPPKVETPKPEPPKPEPPKPEPPEPEPTPPPKVETSEPKVLTTPEATTSNSAPVPPVEASPVEDNEAVEETNIEATEETVAINSPPPEIAEPITNPAGISCVANCQPEYPDALDGDEGSAGVRLSIAPDGKVQGVELINPHSNSMVNRQALLAARQMQFSKINNEAGALVVVRINFTVEGSEFDDLARERQEQLEAREAKQEAERQQKLEAQKQEQERRRSELEQQRREEIQQQEAESSPEADNTGNLTEEELEAERIRKFRQRLENYE